MKIKSLHAKLALLGILMANTAYGVTSIPINGGLTGCRFYVPQDPATEEQRGRIYYDREALSVDGNWLKRRDLNSKSMPFMFSLIKVSQSPSYDEYVAVQEGTNHRCLGADGHALSNGMRTFNIFPKAEGCEAASKIDPNLRWSTTWSFEPALQNYYSTASQRASRFLYQDFGKLHLWARTGGISRPVSSLGNSLAMLGGGRLGGNTQNPVPTPGLECSGVRTPSDVQVPSNNIEPGERAFERHLLPLIQNAQPRPQHFSVRNTEMRRLFNRALGEFGSNYHKVMSVAQTYGETLNLPHAQRQDAAIKRAVEYWQAMDEIRPAMETFIANNAARLLEFTEFNSSLPSAAIDSAVQRIAINKDRCNHLPSDDQSMCAKEELRRRILRPFPDNSHGVDLSELPPSSGAAHFMGNSFQARLAMPQYYLTNPGRLESFNQMGLNIRVSKPYWASVKGLGLMHTDRAHDWVKDTYIVSLEITRDNLAKVTGWTPERAFAEFTKAVGKSTTSGLEFHAIFQGGQPVAYELNMIAADMNLKATAIEYFKAQLATYAASRMAYETFGLFYSSDNAHHLYGAARNIGAGLCTAYQAVRTMCRVNAVTNDLSHMAEAISQEVSASGLVERLNSMAVDNIAGAANINAAQAIAAGVANAADPEIVQALNAGVAPAGERTWAQFFTQPTHWFGESSVPIVELSWRTRWKAGQGWVPVSTAIDFSLLYQNRANVVRAFNKSTPAGTKVLDVHVRQVHSQTYRMYIYSDWDYMKANVFNLNDKEQMLTNVTTGR
ncbi:hypothetical protein [Ideonella sp.]|jgi:hypothetical protein|uniref:hypothetical protein n=1 Tax=Ideonella sp. TaxID=1929293 RepID=UPI0037C06163